jgi:hypothetical protein
LQRLGVSPDGSNVVFEVNDEFSIAYPPTLSPDQKGFFLARSDGSEPPIPLGPASRDKTFDVAGGSSVSPPIAFSPNGRRIAFTDLGPGPGGEETIQIVVLDLATHDRTQVTRLPTGTGPGLFFLTCCPTFIDNETVVFQTYTDPEGLNPEHNLVAFTVRIDGTNFTRLPSPVAVKGSQLVPTFGVFGRDSNLLRLPVDGTPAGYQSTPLADPLAELLRMARIYPIVEIFSQHGKNLLQLTTFHRPDMYLGFLNPNQTRAFFLGSGDPLGKNDPLGGNPNNICQMFSVDTLSGGLRQITHFAGRYPGIPGCFWYGQFLHPDHTCGIGQTYYRTFFQDPVTEAIIFDTSCDPLGTTALGEQIFAMRPNGEGLRQLTDAAGFTTNPDGSIQAELPGPYAYSAPRR